MYKASPLIPCVSLPLPGSVVEQVSASDADTGENAVISYRIQRGGYDDFAIDSETGVITVARKLDFDRRQSYDIEILATDGGMVCLTFSGYHDDVEIINFFPILVQVALASFLIFFSQAYLSRPLQLHLLSASLTIMTRIHTSLPPHSAHR